MKHTKGNISVTKKRLRKRRKVYKRYRLCAIIVSVLFILLIISLMVSVIRSSKNKIEIEESIIIEDTIEPESEAPLFIFSDGNRIIINDVEDYPEETTSEETDYSLLVTSTQYVLGEGVRARKTPDPDGEIIKVIYDIYSPVGVISTGEWYECVIDNKICYINHRYIGDKNDVEYVKEKRKVDEKRKMSAYYNAFKNVSEEEINLMAKIVALEAGDEPWEGKLAVVEVIMNRVIGKNPNWPNTVHDVIYQKGQFSTVKYLSHPYNTPGDEEYDAIEYVRNNGPTVLRDRLDTAGHTNVNSLDYVYFATYYANGTGPTVWIGGHCFARDSSKYYRKR